MPPLVQCPQSDRECLNYWDHFTPGETGDGCFHGCERGEAQPAPPPPSNWKPDPFSNLRRRPRGPGLFGYLFLPVSAFFAETQWREVARKTDDPPLN